MYNRKSIVGWIFLSILTSSAVLPVLCYPSLTENSQLQPQIVLPEGRKFAEKPNATKKVQSSVEDRNDLDDISTNQIPVSKLISIEYVLASISCMDYIEIQ